MTDDLKHGGALDWMQQAFPTARQPWIDLSTGINPWPYADIAVPTESFHHLPTHSDLMACTMAMANAYGAAAEAILPVPGSELAIRLLPSILKVDKVAILSPSYADHQKSWTNAGAEIIETDDPLAHAGDVDAIVLCNPNNPNGRIFEQSALEQALCRLQENSGYLIIDEAYAELVPDVSMAGNAGRDGLIILRSFGKFYGLAGLRLGALLAPPRLIKAMGELLGVWPLSGAALEIGTRAYRDTEWQELMRQQLGLRSQKLRALLEDSGLSIAGGTDLFQFIESPDAGALWKHLSETGIYIRRFKWSPNHLRIGLPASPVASERLREVLSDF